jgi:hypothetical protein
MTTLTTYAPITARGDGCRDAARMVVAGVFDRAGTPIPGGRSGLDRHLAGIAAATAGLYVRAVEDDDSLPLPLVTDLLTIVAALREVLGMSPTPVNAQVYWGSPYA